MRVAREQTLFARFFAQTASQRRVLFCALGYPTHMDKRDEHAHKKEWAGFVEYLMYLQDRRRLLLTNFLAGLMRGMGFAVGFSILGAIVVIIIQRLALISAPGVGAFFAEVVRIVQLKMY